MVVDLALQWSSAFWPPAWFSVLYSCDDSSLEFFSWKLLGFIGCITHCTCSRLESLAIGITSWYVAPGMNHTYMHTSKHDIEFVRTCIHTSKHGIVRLNLLKVLWWTNRFLDRYVMWNPVLLSILSHHCGHSLWKNLWNRILMFESPQARSRVACWNYIPNISTWHTLKILFWEWAYGQDYSYSMVLSTACRHA